MIRLSVHAETVSEATILAESALSAFLDEQPPGVAVGELTLADATGSGRGPWHCTFEAPLISIGSLG